MVLPKKNKNRRQSTKLAEEELAQKVMMFDKMPDNCLTCEAPFDRKNREMAMTWSVVVREQEELVRLYCPECWDKAASIAKQFMEERGKNVRGA